MKIFAFTLGCLLLIGCGPKTVPVSSTKETVSNMDSTSTKSEVTKDSSSYRETLKEKTLPPATVGITLNKEAFDSLILALGSLPSSVPKTVYYQDPKLRAMLSLVLDSLGNLQLNCTALEQKYFEKETEYKKYLSQLVNENRTLKTENTTLKSEVQQQKPSWLQRTWSNFKSLGFWTFLIGFLVLVLGIGVFKKFSFFK